MPALPQRKAKMLILDTGKTTKKLASETPGNPDCWRIVDYADSEWTFGTQYTFELLNSSEMRIVGHRVCFNFLSPILHFALVNGLRGVRGGCLA